MPHPSDQTFHPRIPDELTGTTDPIEISQQQYVDTLAILVCDSIEIQTIRGLVVAGDGRDTFTLPVFDLDCQAQRPDLYRAITQQTIPDGADLRWLWTLYQDIEAPVLPGAACREGVAVLRVTLAHGTPHEIDFLLSFPLPDQAHKLDMIIESHGLLALCPVKADIVTASILIETDAAIIDQMLLDAGARRKDQRP